MTASTATAAINLSDISALEGALQGAPSVMGTAGFAFHALRTALDAAEEAGDTGGFGFSADDFGKRAFDANNAGVKAGISGTDSPEERARRDQNEQALEAFSDSFEAMFGDPLTMFGVRMSAAQWRAAANTLKDKGFQDQMRTELMREGKTAAEANQINDIMARAFDIKAKQANGEPLTQEERDFMRDNAPTISTYTPRYAAASNEYQQNRDMSQNHAIPIAENTDHTSISLTKIASRDFMGDDVVGQSNEQAVSSNVTARPVVTFG